MVRLVDRFYDRVRLDPMLSPVFAHVDWPIHLPVMYAFWSSLLLGEASYQGNPFQKHLTLRLTVEHFDRWLELFSLTTRQEFAGPRADEAVQRAHTIASLFKHKLGLPLN